MIQGGQEHLISASQARATAACGTVEPDSVFRVLRRRSPIVAAVLIASLILTVGFLAAVTPRYSATATIFVDARRNISADSGIPPSSSAAADDSDVDSQVLLIQSAGVLRRVVKELRLAADDEFAAAAGPAVFSPRRWASTPGATEETAKPSMAVESLGRTLSVVRQGNTFVIAVTATSREPRKAASIANAVVSAYYVEEVRSKSQARRAAAAVQQRLDSTAVEPDDERQQPGTTRQDDQRPSMQTGLTTTVSSAPNPAPGPLQGADLPGARVVAAADVPIRPSFPQPTLFLGLAPFFGLGLGCVLALIVDRRDHKIKTLEQAAVVAGHDGLAAMPAISPREIARLAKRGRDALERYDHRVACLLPPALQPPLMRYAVDEPTSLFAEAVRAVRLAIQRAGRAKASTRSWSTAICATPNCHVPCARARRPD
jgi:capsular polysaccharide biosynthesis protein